MTRIIKTVGIFASDIPLLPGHWPVTIEYQEAVWTKDRAQLDDERDVQSVVYVRDASGVRYELNVWND